MIRKITFFAILFLIVNMTFSQEMSQWRGMKRDGIYQETGLLKVWPENGPNLLWHFEGLGAGHSSASVTKDRVYTAGTIKGIGTIFAFSMDGKPLWQVPYGEEWTESWPGVRSTPLIYDGRLYQMSGFGKIVCMNADNGAIIWDADMMKEYGGENIQWGVTENLLIDGNKLFCTVGGKEHNVIALDRMTGKLIWSCKGNGEKSAYCSPMLISLSSRKILVTHSANSILGIDAENGKLLWSREWPNKYSVHANTPLYSDGQLFCVSGYGKGNIMLKLSSDGSSVEELWRNTSLDNRMGGFVLLNGIIYGSDDSGKAWWCLDWKTGKELGSGKPTGKGNIISAEGMLYCYGESGEIALVEPLPDGFKKISSFKVPYGADQHWAHLVIMNGRLYVRHGTSLMVYDLQHK